MNMCASMTGRMRRVRTKYKENKRNTGVCDNRQALVKMVGSLQGNAHKHSRSRASIDRFYFGNQKRAHEQRFEEGIQERMQHGQNDHSRSKN